MKILYNSTRGQSEKVTASQAILRGLADDGGLYVPQSIPKLDLTIEQLTQLDYKQTAYAVMKQFLTDFNEEELKSCIEKAYDSKFDTSEITPIIKANGAWFLELFHGATIAFKDMALSILPHLLTTAAKKNNVKNDIVILTATSGDTGKAALEGFADVEGTKIIVFYPKSGVSAIQEKQMVTQKGSNTYVVGIEGNFDDAQTGVKTMFRNRELETEMLEQGMQFSSANSINIGRLVPQVVYYVYAYARLVKTGQIKNGETLNVTVPTGNFGNILAGYYAKQMGIPIGKFICASNDNKVLFDFFNTGIYNKNRKFILTSSPSMDILVSSNLERLLYILADQDPVVTKDFMESLQEKGEYRITDKMREKLSDFVGYYASEEEVSATIREISKSDKYVIDTHTAVAAAAYHKYTADSGDSAATVIVSTASPYKFTVSVMEAIEDKDLTGEDDFVLVDKLHDVSGVKIPAAIEDIRNAEVLHEMVCHGDEMEETVRKILGSM